MKRLISDAGHNDQLRVPMAGEFETRIQVGELVHLKIDGPAGSLDLLGAWNIETERFDDEL